MEESPGTNQTASNIVKTSLPNQSAPVSLGVSQGLDSEDFQPHTEAPKSPAFSDVSTADGADDVPSSPPLPPLPLPSLSAKAQELLKTPPPPTRHDHQFGTASWGSPYPQTDRNLRRLSFSSEPSDDSPIHHLEIGTRFLRPAPELLQAQEDEQSSSLSAAAAVLANRARRQKRGLTEDWIRAHTTGEANSESRHWFSEGSGSEHSSLSGSEVGWLEEPNFQTPRPPRLPKAASRHRSRYRQDGSSIDTLKPNHSISPNKGDSVEMATSELDAMLHDATSASDEGGPPEVPNKMKPAAEEPSADNAAAANGEPKPPMTPTKAAQKPLPKEPAMTPRLKKKVPWKGKNIMVLLPRDDERGLPGKSPRPLRPDEIERMFDSWEELGYPTDGFDLLVEGYQPPGTDDAQSRDPWPNAEDVRRDRADRKFKVTLPDLNAWKNYVNELQEAKLRALGVSFADEPEPERAPSPPTTNPSRQPSAQYPPLPFSPPIPTSSAASNQAMASYPFPAQFAPSQSPGIPNGASPGPFGAPGKFNPRQSISLPASNSPFQLSQQSSQGWTNQAGILQGGNQMDSPMLANLSGLMSPQSPFGIDGLQQVPSPGLNAHQRGQSLQYPILQHQQLQQQQAQRASPRLQDVPEDENEGVADERPSGSSEPTKKSNRDSLQAEIDDAEYHLEEQMRNELEHDDYNPQPKADDASAGSEATAQSHERQTSTSFPVPERFANEPSKPLELHHPRPHSRGHSLTTKNFFDGQGEERKDNEDNAAKALGSLKEIPESDKADDSAEIETNPSNLGTPIQSFDFTKPFGSNHEKTASTSSNPWNDAVKIGSSGSRRNSHESKPSLTKFNVQAPEFKFNPTSTFTPGQFSFSSSNFQPAVFQAGAGNSAGLSFGGPTPQFGGSPSINSNGPTFSPGQSDFSFSSIGPKFRPDAPSFTPFQSLSGSVTSPTASGSESIGNRSSIFGNIDIKQSDIVKPAKKSKAIPIIRPSSRSSAKSAQLLPSSDDDDEVHEDVNGRPADDSRVKRARSAALDGDDVPLFAEQPKDSTPHVEESTSAARPEEGSLLEDGSAEGDHGLPADTSISSIVTSDQLDTKATSAAPSEASPSGPANRWQPFEFRSDKDASSFNDSRPFGEDAFKHAHKKSLSATAEPFTPANLSSVPKDESAKDRLPNLLEPSPLASPVLAHAENLSREASPPLPPKQKSAPKGLGASRFASPPPKPKGLAASRFAKSPSPVEESATSPVPEEPSPDLIDLEQGETRKSTEDTLPSIEGSADVQDREPTFEEIDAVMRQLDTEPSKGVNKASDAVNWHELNMPTNLSKGPESSPQAEPIEDVSTREATSPTPRQYHALPVPVTEPLASTELDDPFVDRPLTPPSLEEGEIVEGSQIRTPVSDWEGAFSDDEQEKLESRAQFFDGRVNEVVGNLLASRLEPLEKALYTIQSNLGVRPRRAPSSRRDMRSASAELQESDADDEDEEPVLRRSMSPRRDRKLEQIRAAVLDGLAAHQRNQPQNVASAAPIVSQEDSRPDEESNILKALLEMKEHLGENLRLDFRGEDLKNIVEDAVERRMPPTPQPDEELSMKVDELSAKIIDLEDKLQAEKMKVEKEVVDRRAAEDLSSELNRKLQTAETRVEVEIINRSVFDQRVADLEERLRHQEELNEQEFQAKRTAEDRLSEVQRLLRIATEEENRLREVVEERDEKIKVMDQVNGETSVKVSLLEAAEANAAQAQSDMTNKINALEADLRVVRQDNHHWRSEAERSDENARRSGVELEQTLEGNKHMQKSLATLSTQLEENERLRESWRAKFLSLQEDMANAAREIAQDNAQRIKKDQEMLARQEVLDARLQAEAKTRERLEVEMERLQMNERSGMRAVNECKRLEGILEELKAENYKLEQNASKHQRYYEEAREAGASEVKRTRMALQTEVDAANQQVNIVREELEEQNSKLRIELDNVKLEADTAKARNEMLLEEAESTKSTDLDELRHKHQNELEDMQARYERQLGNAVEEAQKTENHLLERLSFSASKMEHLQDRIAHLEEKLEVAKEAAAAAAQAAKSAGVEPTIPIAAAESKPVSRKLDLPEKISPQALRESIMVLQEQLQAREQRIEELESTVSKLDPEAPTKISKRDDEITWLRELLAVRHGDLQEIIAALSGENYDRHRVKDAAIRLKANLQMEEQERERAMNGASAINLPSLAQSIQSATPRVAQAVGPLAAAWGSWRKGSQSFNSLSGALNSAADARNATPSKSSPNPQNSLLGGLLTPPASGLRQTPQADGGPQPTAFSSTGRRFPSQGSGRSGRSRLASTSSRQAEKMPAQDTTPPSQRPECNAPMTPPMMSQSVYDEDAQPGDFDDHDFFEED